MNIPNLIQQFEALLRSITRSGIDKLLDYIRKSDFYKAPASTKYHLSTEGGLLLHSLNVLAALQTVLTRSETDPDVWEYRVAGQVVATTTWESMRVMALLHDICKTFFYTTSTRNVKNEQTGKWEKQPFYTINDRMPLGHGDKSVMIIKQYIDLTTEEMYAIWWHMGFTDAPPNTVTTLHQAIEKYPIIWALHTADMMASTFMEGEKGNKPPFDGIFYLQEAAQGAGEYADNPVFEEAAAL